MLLAARVEAAFGVHDVVEESDAEDLAGFDQAFGDGVVFVARARIITRVVVARDVRGLIAGHTHAARKLGGP